MDTRPLPIRFATAMFLGLSAAGACGAAMPENDPLGPQPGRSTAHVGAGEDSPEELARKNGRADAGPDAAPCPHGALEDPHRGFVRCLREDEKDAGWLPPAPQPEPPAADAGSDADAAPEKGPEKPAPEKPAPEKPAPEKPAPEKPAPEKPQPPPAVTVGTPKFEGGEVPKAEKFLNAQIEGIAKCIATNGGLSAKKGSIKLSFLVRARGRAEGVEVASSKGITEAAEGCVRVLLKNRAVGAPSADPVGVIVTYSLERAK